MHMKFFQTLTSVEFTINKAKKVSSNMNSDQDAARAREVSNSTSNSTTFSVKAAALTTLTLIKAETITSRNKYRSTSSNQMLSSLI